VSRRGSLEREIGDAELADRIDEYWEWVAVALFLLTAVDVLTTLGAAAVVGVGGEANPFVRWLLRRSLPALIAVNLLAVVAGTVGFRGVVVTLRRTPPWLRPYYAVARTARRRRARRVHQQPRRDRVRGESVVAQRGVRAGTSAGGVRRS